MKKCITLCTILIVAVIFNSCDVNDGNNAPMPQYEWQIHAVDIDGTNHRILAKGWNLNISPSKNLIIYRDNHSLNSIKYDGTDAQSLLTDDNYWDYYMSENGEKLLFTVIGKTSYDMYIMNIDGSSPSKIFSADNIYKFTPDLSQDMSEIVFTTSWDLSRTNVSGNSFEVLRKHPDSTIFRSPRYILNNSQIVYVEDFRRRSDTTFLRIYDMNTRKDTILLTLKMSSGDHTKYDISPDNKILFLQGNLRATDSLKILDLANRKIIGLDQGGFGKFSPDGRHVIYVNRNSIFMINPDGSDRKTVYSEKDLHFSIWRPALSPDNKTVFYECTQSDYAPKYAF